MKDSYIKMIRHADASELAGILKSIDQDKYPERYSIVEKEIENRNSPGYLKPEPLLPAKYSSRNQYDATYERFWALVIDGVVCFLITSGLYLLMGMGIPKSSNLDLTLIRAIYTIGATYWFSKTLGKHFMGLVVIDHASRGKVSFKQSVRREIGPVVSILIMILAIIWGRTAPRPAPLLLLLFANLFGSFVWAILELVTMFSNDERRALHDKIAGTSVVIKSLMK